MTTATHGYTDAELALLTEDERLGLFSDDDGGDDNGEGGEAKNAATDKPLDSVEALTDEDLANVGDGEGGAGEDGGEGGADADVPVADAAAAAAATPGTAAADVPVIEPDAEITPAAAKYILPPADVDKSINELREQQMALAAKFDEGDLSATEHARQSRELDDKVADLRETKLRATMSFDARKDEWLNTTAPTWLAEHPEYGNDMLFGQLNEIVVKLQQTTFQSNVFDPRIMDLAHAKLKQNYSLMLGTDPKDKGKKPDLPPRPGMPPNLGSLPHADDANLNDGGQFAKLDRLMETDVIAWERELAAMSDSARDAYNSAR